MGADKNNALTISAWETMDFVTSLHAAVQIYDQQVMEREREECIRAWAHTHQYLDV